jgi:UDPglucose 6-dehydrogenase
MYDLVCIHETFVKLNTLKYNGIVVIKSTLEPNTINILQEKYTYLKLIHNPEFLTTRTALNDFNNMTHIVLGRSNTTRDCDVNILIDFYNAYFPHAEISVCSAIESESMKLFLNSFYAVKIQFFTELYLLCQKNKCSYNTVVELMLKNKWINPMHTQVPGPDGNISYGGFCFPKDTNALLNHMIRVDTPHMVLSASIDERNCMRQDNNNVLTNINKN